MEKGDLYFMTLFTLVDLKRLDIVLDNNRAPFITDVAGHLAFMQMPKLKILRFTRYGVREFQQMRRKIACILNTLVQVY